MTTVAIFAVLLIVILFLVGRIVRWWNLPEVSEARRKKTEARQKERTERLRIRRERRASRRPHPSAKEEKPRG